MYIKYPSSSVQLLADCPGDITRLHDLIARGDRVRTTAVLKGLAGRQGRSVQLELELCVETVVCECTSGAKQAAADELRIRGRITYVELAELKRSLIGTNYTASVRLTHQLWIAKDRWDAASVRALKQSLQATSAENNAAASNKTTRPASDGGEQATKHIQRGSKAATQTQVLDEFNELLRVDDTRTAYGRRHVQLAAEAAAIRTLLITEALLR